MTAVSLLVPTYRRPLALARLLHSLRTTGLLDREELEVVVVDNDPGGGQSDVAALCRWVGARYLPEPRRGKCHAVNRGLQHVRGEYVLFTDDDVVATDANWPFRMREAFRARPRLGYLAGNVRPLRTTSRATRSWEAAGGLSKGPTARYQSPEDLPEARARWSKTPMRLICAGANCMVPRQVALEVGGFSIRLENATVIGGGTLEFGYRIAAADYELAYEPDIEVLHDHPATWWQVARRLFHYGVGDVSLPLAVALDHGDLSGLRWALGGEAAHTAGKLRRRLDGDYALPVPIVCAGLVGNLVGPAIFAASLLLEPLRSLAAGLRGQRSDARPSVRPPSP